MRYQVPLVTAGVGIGLSHRTTETWVPQGALWPLNKSLSPAGVVGSEAEPSDKLTHALAR